MSRRWAREAFSRVGLGSARPQSSHTDVQKRRSRSRSCSYSRSVSSPRFGTSVSTRATRGTGRSASAATRSISPCSVGASSRLTSRAPAAESAAFSEAKWWLSSVCFRLSAAGDFAGFAESHAGLGSAWRASTLEHPRRNSEGRWDGGSDQRPRPGRSRDQRDEAVGFANSVTADLQVNLRERRGCGRSPGQLLLRRLVYYQRFEEAWRGGRADRAESNADRLCGVATHVIPTDTD